MEDAKSGDLGILTDVRLRENKLVGTTLINELVGVNDRYVRGSYEPWNQQIIIPRSALQGDIQNEVGNAIYTALEVELTEADITIEQLKALEEERDPLLASLVYHLQYKHKRGQMPTEGRTPEDRLDSSKLIAYFAGMNTYDHFQSHFGLALQGEPLEQILHLEKIFQESKLNIPVFKVTATRYSR